MTTTPELFPVDDVSLANVLHALDAAYGDDNEVVGGEFTLSTLLDFMSGYDPAKGALDGHTEDGTPIYIYPDPIFTPHDVIRATIHEIQALRAALMVHCASVDGCPLILGRQNP